MDHGWNGTHARHEDGREGVIRESRGWSWVDLHIERGGQEIGFVQLGADGPDRGERGWQWFAGKAWYPLGDFDND